MVEAAAVDIAGTPVARDATPTVAVIRLVIANTANKVFNI